MDDIKKINDNLKQAKNTLETAENELQNDESQLQNLDDELENAKKLYNELISEIDLHNYYEKAMEKVDFNIFIHIRIILVALFLCTKILFSRAFFRDLKNYDDDNFEIVMYDP